MNRKTGKGVVSHSPQTAVPVIPTRTVVYVKDGVKFKCAFGLLGSCERGCVREPFLCSLTKEMSYSQKNKTKNPQY